MLIDNKFIYISLPRRGSTSFHYSCILYNLDIKNTGDYSDIENSKIDFKNIDESNIMNHIVHGHVPLIELQEKFGTIYPIIAVYRDRHEVFYSLFKHVIFDLDRTGYTEISKHLSNLTTNELFFWKTDDLVTKKSRWDVISNYLYENGLINKRVQVPNKMLMNPDEYLINIIDILLTPSSVWHNHNKDIIWFNINELSKMEEWISNITNKPFKIKNVNSSSHIDCKVHMDDEFIKNYNNIYDFYDIPKKEVTLI